MKNNSNFILISLSGCIHSWVPTFDPHPHLSALYRLQPHSFLGWVDLSVAQSRTSSTKVPSFFCSIWSLFFPISLSYDGNLKVLFGSSLSLHLTIFISFPDPRAIFVEINFLFSIFFPLKRYYQLLPLCFPFVFPNSKPPLFQMP